MSAKICIDKKYKTELEKCYNFENLISRLKKVDNPFE